MNAAAKFETHKGGKKMEKWQMEFAVAVPGEHYVWNVYSTRAAAEKVVEELKQDMPDRPYTVIDDIDGFFSEARDGFLKPAAAISAENFDDALNVLPPMQWHHAGGCELFCISEFTYDDVTDQYGATSYGGQGGKKIFARKPVRFKLSDTYLTRAEIIAANKGAGII
jgi:hypothetical protein